MKSRDYRSLAERSELSLRVSRDLSESPAAAADFTQANKKNSRAFRKMNSPLSKTGRIVQFHPCFCKWQTYLVQSSPILYYLLERGFWVSDWNLKLRQFHSFMFLRSCRTSDSALWAFCKVDEHCLEATVASDRWRDRTFSLSALCLHSVCLLVTRLFHVRHLDNNEKEVRLGVGRR